jgi:peptidoglycan/xylan/chitin deacetylase (PgdA/CDA1 family)
MLNPVEHPPLLYRRLFPRAVWRLPADDNPVYLTFDDGPHPRITPRLLDLLDTYRLRATFFCVGDNVRKYPDTYRQILARGHAVGNHTHNHLQGLRTSTPRYLENVALAATRIQSPLFRPPHGILRPAQYRALLPNYRIVMWDVVTRDYDPRVTPADALATIRRHTRNGSIIVFHDSEKSERTLFPLLPSALDWLLAQSFRPLSLLLPAPCSFFNPIE